MTEHEPRRFLFSLLHAGYLRGYAGAIQLLAERGHSVHLAIGKLERDPGGVRIADELVAAYPNVTYAAAPVRSRRDPWRALAWLVRAFTDLSRYMHPRYANATTLRNRVALKISNHARSAKQIDPLTAIVCVQLVRLLTRTSGERPLRRALRIFGALERAIPTAASVDRLIEELRPDAVLVVPLVEVASPQLEFLKSAKRLGVRTGVCISSWDNLTNKGLIRILPDRVFVWNDVQRGEAVEMHDVPHDRVVLTGAQRFDEWFERRPSLSPREFALKVGLDPGEPYLLYVCSSPFIAPDEVSFVTRWLEQIRAADDPRLARIGVLVRPHPVNAAQWRDVDLSRFGNVVIRPRGGQQPDAGEARSDYFHSLAHSAAVVGINTSALIESAILGKSVYTVLAPEFRGTQTGTLHFHYLLYENGGFLHVAESLDDHVRQLDRVLTHGKADEEQTLRFVASFIRPNGMDRPATPILADGIEELARLAPPQPVGTPVWAWGLRGLLSLVALFAGLLFALDRLVRRVLYHPTAKTTGRWLLRRRAAAPLARRLEARRASARPRPDLPPKPPQELRLAAVEPSPQVVAVEAELERIAARGAPVVPGPWTGSAEHELLYWRPFLTWARERYGLDLVEPSDAASANGSAVHLPPTLALDLVRGFRTGGAPLGEVLERLRFERLTPPADPELEATLPDEFVAVSLARGPARDRVRDALASRGEIVSANLDGEEPRDAAAQATVVARARVLVAELGPVALLGPFLGVPTIALATPDAAASPDLDVAYRAARALGTAFVVLDSAHVEIAGAVAAAAAA